MPLDPEISSLITTLVRGGFEPRERIIEIITEEMYEPGEFDEPEVRAAVDAALAAHDQDKTTWPAVTDCDRLDQVFSALSAKGIIALQYAGHSQSDGISDVTEAWHSRPDHAGVQGYCFYHGQDLERAVEDGELHLAFGPMDGIEQQTGEPRIGALIADELRRAGFSIEWNGTSDQRICVQDIDWKRR